MFLNVIMLAGIAGAAVPLVLHLLSKARYRPHAWAAMMFLNGADSHQRRSARVKQWLLMSVRMSIILLLAIALARPITTPGASATPASTVAVILLEHSAGKSSGAASGTRTAEARQAVSQVLSSLPRGASASLVSLSDGAAAAGPTQDLQSISDALDSPRFGAAGTNVTDVAVGLSAAANIFEQHPSSRRMLFLICDRQAIIWRNVSEQCARAWSARMARAGAAPEFVVLPMGGAEAAGVVIESVSAGFPQVVVGQTPDIQITIRNFGPSARSAIPLSIDLDGRPADTAAVDIPARGTATIHSYPRLGTIGSHIVTVRIASGNGGGGTFNLAAEVTSPISVLAIGGSNGEAPRPDYLKLALMPFSAAGRGQPDLTSMKSVDVSTFDGWGGLNRRAYRVVILNDVSQLTSAQGQALEQYVRGGGGLLVAPGTMTRVASFNAVLYRDGAGVMPAGLEEPPAEDESETTSIGQLDASNPIFGFLHGKVNDAASVKIRRYFPISAIAPAANVIGRYAAGSPWVVTANFGRGRVVLFTTSLDGGWNDLPLSELFLPLLQNTVRYLAAGKAKYLNPGDEIVADFYESAGALRAQLTAPDGTRSEIPLQAVADFFEARTRQTAKPGVYSVTVRRQTQRFAVNMPVEQFDPTPLSAQQWQQLSDELGFKTVDLTQTPLASTMGSSPAPREWWAALIAVVIALGLGEIVLNRIWSGPARGAKR